MSATPLCRPCLAVSCYTLAILGSAAVLAGQRDLGKIYPATIDYDPGGKTRAWTCAAKDVWRLARFHYKFEKQEQKQKQKLEIKLGRSQVVFGTHESNVMWAVVFPDKPARFSVSHPGDGERVVSIWMRFHPARVGELFPSKTVKGQGQESWIVWARRVYQAKISSGWQAGNQPVVPKYPSIVFDIQTEEGPRRYYPVNTEKGKVEYVKFFTNKTLPQTKPIKRKDALKAFDAIWEAFDREYAMFTIKPKVDWPALKKKFRPQASRAKTSYGAAAAISAMLSCLEDLHVSVRVGKEWVPGFTRKRPLNGNWKAVEAMLEKVEDTRKDIAWGRTKDGIGYVSIYRLQNQESRGTFDAVLEKLADSWGLVLDLRFNGGGDELLARHHAGRFLDRARVYSYNQYRSGPKHDDLGRKLSRECETRGPWRYQSPVVVLIGQRTMSSAESFALMLAQCPQVTTMGDRTAGSSGNPRLLELPGEIRVRMPRWLDMDPDGKPFEGVGIRPDVEVEAVEGGSSRTQDPVLAAALKQLRGATERKTGKRD